MSATPLLRPLRVAGGTIYVFNSSANDIAQTFSDDNFRFTFSKFAALDIPKVNQPSNNSNNITWQGIGNKGNLAGATAFDYVVLDDMINGDISQNTYIANSFQNYVLNWENLVLNQQNSDGNLYDSTTYQSTTERIFWKWLGDLGAIRYEGATATDANIPNLFVEETENTAGATGIDTYHRVVKYLGDIDLINNVNRGGEAYTQIYLHMPTEHGNTPTVLFNVLSDNNYKPTLKWFGTNGNDIEGRTAPADARMSIKAYFDDNTSNFYTTESIFGDATNTTISVPTSLNGSSSYDIDVTNMDGITIDWDSAKYTKIVDNPAIQSISEFNSTAEAQDFQFNAVLIYYDIFDASDTSLVKRNLYGVLFIDDFEETISNGSDLKSFGKFKTNPITKLNGNAYSLKTNLKFDTSADNVGVERSINEYSTFSMDLFSDAMVQLQDATDNFISQQLTISNLSTEVDTLKSFYYNQATIDIINSEILTLQETVSNALIALESPTTLIELIRNNSTRINSLAAGELTTDLSYNLDPFTQGSGIKLDKSVPNKVIISNTVEKYNAFPICYNDAGSLNYTSGNGVTNTSDINYPIKNNIINLGLYTNYFKNTTVETLLNANDVIINIDDTVDKFKTGQVLRIVFENGFTLDGTKFLYIYTDAENKKQQGAYNWLVVKLSSVDFISSKPIIEIVCTNETLSEFTVDVLR
tara:strand:- start:569 stop:2662 length:2094 start_codon:yes stop_codon:yes gene_type:complete